MCIRDSLPDEQKIGFYQVRPGNAGYAERADAQQQGAEKPEYSDGEGHGLSLIHI